MLITNANEALYNGKSAEAMRREWFEPVAARMRAKGEALKHITRFTATGIEGWFKVEVIAAMGEHVEKLRNVGADLGLCGNCWIELKASTDLTCSWIAAGLKYNAPCLFLGNMSRTAVEKLKADPQMLLISHETFSDGSHDWIVGLVLSSSRAQQ